MYWLISRPCQLRMNYVRNTRSRDGRVNKVIRSYLALTQHNECLETSLRTVHGKGCPTTTVQCCFTYTETVQTVRDGDIRPGRPPLLWHSFWALSDCVGNSFLFNVALRPQRPYGLLQVRSPGRPPRLSHTSWALRTNTTKARDLKTEVASGWGDSGESKQRLINQTSSGGVDYSRREDSHPTHQRSWQTKQQQKNRTKTKTKTSHVSPPVEIKGWCVLLSHGSQSHFFLRFLDQ